MGRESMVGLGQSDVTLGTDVSHGLVVSGGANRVTDEIASRRCPHAGSDDCADQQLCSCLGALGRVGTHGEFCRPILGLGWTVFRQHGSLEYGQHAYSAAKGWSHDL